MVIDGQLELLTNIVNPEFGVTTASCLSRDIRLVIFCKQHCITWFVLLEICNILSVQLTHYRLQINVLECLSDILNLPDFVQDVMMLRGCCVCVACPRVDSLTNESEDFDTI